jgi:hypothetical protein
MNPDDEIQAVLNAPCTSAWLRQALETALKRDCVDAVNDAERLTELLSARFDRVLGALLTAP